MMTKSSILGGSSEEHKYILRFVSVKLNGLQCCLVLSTLQNIFVLNKAIQPKIDKIVSIRFSALTFANGNTEWNVDSL